MTQTLTTEQLRAHAESLGLDFFIERRAGIWVKEWLNDGCTSATAEEVLLWSMLANREAQPVTSVIPDIGSTVVNDAAWKLHDTLTEHGPLNGRQFNNLKGCLYEALKIVMNAPPAPAVPEEIGIQEAKQLFNYLMTEKSLTQR